MAIEEYHDKDIHFSPATFSTEDPSSTSDDYAAASDDDDDDDDDAGSTGTTTTSSHHEESQSSSSVAKKPRAVWMRSLVFLILAATATLVGLEAFRISSQQQEEKFEQGASCVKLCGVHT
jgi:hypothetical protein